MQKKAPTALICLSPNKGGMELASLKLAKTLSQYIKTTLIIKDNSFMHEQCLNNPDYFGLKFETIKFHYALSFSIIYKAREIVLKNNIQNVIFVGASELKSLYFSFLGLDINLIVRHGTTKSNPKKDFFHKLVYSNIATHVAISNHIADNVKYIVPFGKNTKLITIIPSMPKERSKNKKTLSDRIELLHVGRITPGKGLKEALLACEVLYDNNIVFNLDSYGNIYKNYKDEFENFINTLKYKNNFHMCGFTNNIYDEYPKHDIFIFPTKGEGFGNVLMEAIAHGIIILSFDNSAVKEFKEMEFHIHLAKDGSIKSLKEKLLYIAKNIDKERKLSEENITKAEKIFSAKREAMEYIALLR